MRCLVQVMVLVGCLLACVNHQGSFYPEAELWRPRLFYITLAIFVALLAYERTPKRTWIWLFFVNIYPFLIAGLFTAVSST